MKTTRIAILATLWRFIFWTWSVLIIGAIAGVLGNTGYTYFTTGSITFKDLPTLAVVTWFNAHIILCVLIFTLALIFTLCSFLAHRQQQQTIQKHQQQERESLITIVGEIHTIGKGIQQALNEGTPTYLSKPLETVNPETPPQTIWHVPYRRNPFFTGREQLLTTLHKNLTASKTTALTQAQAINGLGGIGKTQVAIEYAYCHREDYHFIFWVNAATRETLIADYVTIAHLLHLPSHNEQDQNIVVEAVKNWLTTTKDCLLILDNADELNIIDLFLPTENTCHILITTREQTTNPLAQNIEVEKMDSQESILMLLRRASIIPPDKSLDEAKQEDKEIAEKIVQAMDGLPLALDQAGAYIEKTQCTLPTYLHAYTHRQADLLHQRGTYSIYHTEPVATTWSLSFEQVEKRNPLAADLLRCCAFFAPDDIPEEFFTEGANELSPLLQSITNDSSLLDEAIGELRRFSLVRRNQNDRTFSIHRLVQAILKANLDEATQQAWAERAVHMVNHLFPGTTDITTWKQCQRYVTHAQTCATFIETFQLASPEAALLLNQTASYLDDLALYPEAEPLYQRALRIREQMLGPEHPHTASSLNNLAGLYDSQGKYEQAEPLYQRALHIYEQVLGPEHPDTATCLGGLACLYYSQGKNEQAEPLYQRALRIREQVLGPEHPHTASSLDGLAGLYNSQGKYEQAEPLHQRALHISEQVLGPQHPDTARSLNNLAGLYRSQNKPEQAEPFYQRALHINEQVLGPEHPDTAQCLNNLGELYRSQNKPEQAEPLLISALHIREKALGPEHPDTAQSLNNMAELYSSQGKYKQAEPLYQRALRIREQVLGPQHPDTAQSLNNLAGLYYSQGQYEQAEPLLKRALAIMEKTLGSNHPSTVTVRENYTIFLEDRRQRDREKPKS